MTTPELHDYPGLSATLVDLLGLDRAPVGIKVFESAQEYAQWPAPEPAAPTFYCGFVKIAAGRDGVGGRGYKIRAEHFRCDTAAHLLGVDSSQDADEFERSYLEYGLYRDEAVARTALAGVPSMSGNFGFAVQPLSEFGEEHAPDVVIVIAPSQRAMRLVQGYSFHNGEGAVAHSVGMHGICAESTAAPLEQNRMCVSLMCSGTRHVARWHDGEVAVSMPASCLHSAIDGVLQTVGSCESDVRKRQIIERGRAAGEDLEAQVRLGSGYFCQRPGHSLK